MKKQTKNTLKVLSTLALAGGVAFGTAGTADAKTYKPEVRYDNGNYFVKTSDPSAKGKNLVFSTDGSNTSRSESQVSILYSYDNYNGEELNISDSYKKGELGKTFTPNTPFSIVDDELPEFLGANDPESVEKTNKFTASAKSGFTTVNKLNVNEGKVETPQPTKPVETPVKPKEEKKETPTTTQTENPKTTQASTTTPEKKVTDKKETPTPKATQTQEQTKDNKQVTEKRETTAKPLPKTTAETFGGLTLYTFGGLSLLSILAFFSLRKKQK